MGEVVKARSSGQKTMAEIRKALALLAQPAPGHIALSGVSVTNSLTEPEIAFPSVGALGDAQL